MLTILNHEPGNPLARLGSAPGRVSSANGRRLRARRGTLPVVAGPLSDRRGAYIFRLDLPFSGSPGRAIAECKRAIEIDPEFGNPYNDIGAYLIELDRFDEAIPWLERAVEAARYEPRHFPHYNLGRAYLGKEMYARAAECFQQALEIEPRYALARDALDSLRRMVN